MIDCNSLNDFNPRLKAGRSAAMNKLEHTRLLLDCANPFWLLVTRVCMVCYYDDVM